ncbi:MAG: alcohol dehydrogenase catalytic domain-containing protein, partial [Rhodospirillaceae bacterium]|nr:alcohol dehydrogenase catalytic domain-containing protein [Rhodospirillaceae bacterium]
MKAAVWHEGASALSIENIADPEPITGSAVIAVEAGFVTGALVQRMSERPSMIFPPFPFVPGMDTVGRVTAVADDVVGLAVGERVYCDHFYGSHGMATVADRGFLGSFGIDPGCSANMARWGNGNMAEKLMLPAECMTPVGAAGDVASPALLCRMGWYGTAYGGFLNAGLAPGETVI